LHITALQTVRRTVERKLVLHRTIELEPLDCVVVDELPATSATRTILDLGAVLSGEQLEVAFESARRAGLTSASAVARRFEKFGGRGREGSARVRQLLDAVGERPAESTLEVKTNRLLRRSRIRPPQLQVWITGSDGRRYRVDFVWVDARLIVECDGFAWHGQHLAWKRDRRRIAALEAAGWRVVHVTWDDVVKYPAETLFRIATALERAA
jgi:very-short-patch-repair endonuclease